MSAEKRLRIAVVSMVLLASLVMATSSQAAALTVTVTGVSDGVTEYDIGACEALQFNIADITDLGVGIYRIWGSSAETEPVDDDGVYGSPTIAEIKADPDIIPWSTWDTNMKATDFRAHGVSFYDMLLTLKNNDVKVVTSLVNVNNKDQPLWMQQLNPPTTTEDWNEWWEHVFAMVYYTNVLNDLDVHDWQVLNEPDNDSQGWGGTLADYITFTQYTADAIQYVYDTYLPGESFKLYAPVATHCNEWIEETLLQNDAIVDVIDWHRYGPPYSEASQINAWINAYDSDGQQEYPFCSEWGSYRGGYDSHGSAINYSGYIVDHSVDPAGFVGGSTIFSMYEWGGQMDGIIMPDGTKTPTFYAMRLVIRGLQGGNTRYVIAEEPPRVHKWVASVDEATNTMHVLLWSKGVKDDVVTIDVSAHVSSATASLRRYAEGVNDVDIGTAQVTNGVVAVDLLASSMTLVSIPLDGGPVPTDTPSPSPTVTIPPTPTHTPKPGVLHVGDIAMSCSQQGPFYKGVATVTILDVDDQPVDLATVFGTFSGASSDSVSGDTGDDGTVALESSKVKNGGTWTFTVDDVVKSGWTYDPAANVETSDQITCP
jgi:hypothetical protein